MSHGSPDTEKTRASLELLYHISRELASDLDLKTVLERVLFLSMKNTGAIRGSIIVMDDEGQPVESAVIAGDQVMDRNTHRLRATLVQGLAGWVVEHKQTALIKDTSVDDRWMLQQYEIVDENIESKSAVSSPLMVRDRLVGVITLVHPQPNFFKEEHLSLVQSIADQAGIAVLNGRLYQESQRQARVMTALAETAATVNTSLNREEVFLRILDQIIQALSVQAVCLALLDPDQDQMVVQATKGWVQEHPEKKTIRVGEGIAGWSAQKGRSIIVNDAQNDDRFNAETLKRTGLNVKSIACAPLKHRGQVIGVIEVINPKDGRFDSDALLVLTGIGSLAGTAVRHAQLFEQMQAAHQSYRELFDDSIDPIFISNLDGKIIEANRKAALVSGYKKNDLRKRVIHQLHTIDQISVGNNLEKLSLEKTISYESRLRTSGNHEIPVQVYVRKVTIEGKLMVQWLMRDITERKNLDSMREDLTSMIYHDLRSPLANVVSSLELLGTMLPDEDQTFPSLVNIALRSTQRIQRLTNSLLDISRMEAGQPVVNRQFSDPIAMILEAFDIVNPVVENKNQTLTTYLPDTLPKVSIDVEMVKRAVVNILENASKFSPSGAEIQLGANQEGSFLQIWVKDNGPGIPASEQERIFHKFTRINQRESTSKGLGLGLAYCRLAVEAHQGNIQVESEFGKGTRFILNIPINGQHELNLG